MQSIPKTVNREANPDLVNMRARIERAFETLRGLQVYNTAPGQLVAKWPSILRDYWEAYGNVVFKNKPPRPTPRAISDLDQISMLIALALDVVERGVVWDRAARLPWKLTCKRLRCDRTSAWRVYTIAVMKMVAMEKGYKWKDGAEDIEQLAPKIYAIQGENSKAVKIGFSFTPEKRMSDLQVASPEKLSIVGVCYGSRHQERAIHAHLSPHKLSGEWFAWEPMVQETVNKIIACEKADEVLQHLEAWRRNKSEA